jgi:hypothetical protein
MKSLGTSVVVVALSSIVTALGLGFAGGVRSLCVASPNNFAKLGWELIFTMGFVWPAILGAGAGIVLGLVLSGILVARRRSLSHA